MQLCKKMSLEEETYQKFGYRPNELAQQSHKYIISRCTGCGEIREIQKRHAPGYCRKCAQSKEGHYASNRIILTGDWHIGAGSVNFDELKDVAKHYFKGHPVILLGDLVDIGLDKGMNFSNITNEDLALAVKKLNRRPRKCLYYQTPHEVFYSAIRGALAS